MKTPYRTRFKKRKALLLNVHERKNNLFCNISVTRFRMDPRLAYMRRHYKQYRLRKAQMRLFRIKRKMRMKMQMLRNRVTSTKLNEHKAFQDHTTKVIMDYVEMKTKPRTKEREKKTIETQKDEEKKTAEIKKEGEKNPFQSYFIRAYRNVEQELKKRQAALYGNIKFKRYVKKKLYENYDIVYKEIEYLWQMRKTKLQRYKNMFNPANHVVFNTIRRKQRLLYELSNGSCRPKSTGPIRQTPYLSGLLGLKMGRFIKRKQFKKYYLIIIIRTKFSRNLRTFFNSFIKVHPKVFLIFARYKRINCSVRPAKARRV
jgi:hypothetical protein